MIAVNDLNILEALNRTTLSLKGGSILSPRVEAEIIIGHATGLSRAELFLNRERTLTGVEKRFLETAVADRARRKPLQYILGSQHFRYLNLICKEGVLIPRPETELLVDVAIAELKQMGGARTVLDIGSGTGAIALSIAHEYKDAEVIAADISQMALVITRENALLNGLLEKVQIVESDLFDALGNLRNRLDMVVSNPPYIPSEELGTLQLEVQHEPSLALDGGADGLDFYRAIIEKSPEFLKPGGVLVFEVGFGQASDVMNLLKESGVFKEINSYKDYQGIDRIVRAGSL